MIYFAFRPIEPVLLKRIDDIMSKAEPELGEKLGIESVKQIKELLQKLETLRVPQARCRGLLRSKRKDTSS